MSAHNILGKAGEDAAAKYLEQNGYTIRDRNWRKNHLEPVSYTHLDVYKRQGIALPDNIKDEVFLIICERRLTPHS